MQELNNLSVVPFRLPPQFIVLICVLICVAIFLPVALRILLLLLRNSILNFSQRRLPGLAAGLFERNPDFVTDGEHAFLPALEQAVGDRYRITMKARLGDLVIPRAKSSVAIAACKIANQLHVDFVLCTHYPVKPLLVIELDDSSHERLRAQRRDRFVDACLGSAGLPILHVPCQQAYDVGQLAAEIQAMIGRGILTG